MSEDFFGDLGKSITKAAGDVVDKTGDFFESTKLKAQIAGEEKCVDKGYRNIGEVVYRKHAEGMEVSEEVQALIDEINQHVQQIGDYKEELAQLKGQKVCPACQALIEQDAAFCPKCGAAVPEPEHVDSEPVEEAEPEAAEAPAEETAEAAEPTPEAAPETDSAPAEDPKEEEA